MTFLRYDAIEQNESHHAADVEKDEEQRKRHHSEQRDADDEENAFARQYALSKKLIRPIRTRKSAGHSKAQSLSSSGAGDFSRERTDQTDLDPLRELERAPKELLFHVLESRLNDIRG